MVDIQASPNSLTQAQTYSLVRNNGGSPQEAGLLTAIAFGAPGGVPESSGNPTVINNTPATGDYSVGLWQINFRTGVNQPVASSRTIGGTAYTPSGLQNDLNQQAQAALAILRSTQGSWSALSTQWGGFRSNPAGVWAFGQQLASSLEGQITSIPSDLGIGGGTTDTAPNPTVGIQGQTGTNATTGVQGQTQATTGLSGTTTPGSGSPLNLNFAGSLQHLLMQFLLVLIAIAILLGGIYLLGSGHNS